MMVLELDPRDSCNILHTEESHTTVNTDDDFPLAPKQANAKKGGKCTKKKYLFRERREADTHETLST